MTDTHKWIDDLGYEWRWDGNRVYCIETEDFPNNGYLAWSLDEAIEWMSGYMDDPTDWKLVKIWEEE